MKNLYIQLYLVNIDFESESFETIETVINEWSLKNVEIIESDIYKLFDCILNDKGDWVDFYLDSNKNRICIDIKLLITRVPLLEEDRIVAEEPKKIIESFLENINIVNPNSQANENERHLPSSTSEAVNFLKINLPARTSTDFRDEIMEEMQKKGLEPYIETTGISINEAGASGGGLEIIFAFLGASINSGITYDLLKMAFKEIPFLKEATVNWSEEKEYTRTRRQIAKRARVDEKSLILIDFIQNNFHNYIFRSEAKFIYVKVDYSNNILEYKLLRSKQEVREIFEREK